MQFALVCFLVAFSYPLVRLSFAISSFRSIATDMIDGQPIPTLSSWVFQSPMVVQIICLLVPMAGVFTLADRNISRSFSRLLKKGCFASPQFSSQ